MTTTITQPLRVSRHPPLGWEIDPKDDKRLRPIPEVQEVLVEITQLHTAGALSYDQLVRILNAKTGRSYTRAALFKHFHRDRKYPSRPVKKATDEAQDRGEPAESPAHRETVGSEDKEA